MSLGISPVIEMRIKLTDPDTGYLPDQKRVKEYLTVGEIYTIRRINVEGFHTDVWLEGVPVAFNSVHFTEV